MNKRGSTLVKTEKYKEIGRNDSVVYCKLETYPKKHKTWRSIDSDSKNYYENMRRDEKTFRKFKKENSRYMRFTENSITSYNTTDGLLNIIQQRIR